MLPDREKLQALIILILLSRYFVVFGVFFGEGVSFVFSETVLQAVKHLPPLTFCPV